MKQFFIISALILFQIHGQAQYATLSTYAGTGTYGTTSVTVTSSGTASTYPGWCGAGNYWIGSGSGAVPDTGYYTYTFSPAIKGIRVQVTAADSLSGIPEKISIYINGSLYYLTPANYTVWAGACGQPPMHIIGGVMVGSNSSGSSTASGGQLDIIECGITSVSVATNGVWNGSVYTFEIDTTGSCLNVSNNGPVCFGDSLRLYSSGYTNGTVVWHGPNGFTSTAPNPVIAAVTVADGGTYNLIHTTPTYTDSASTVVVVNHCFSAINNSPVCPGDTIKLFTIGASSVGSYYWYGPSGFSSTTVNPVIPNATSANAGTYYLVHTVGLNSDTVSTIVTIKSVPVATLSSNGPVCENTILTLSAIPDSVGETFLWTGPSGFSSTSPNPVISPVTLACAGVYSVAITLQGCHFAASIPVVVNPAPAPPTTTNLKYCSGDTAAALTAVGSNLQWYMNATGGIALPIVPVPNTSSPSVSTWYVSQTVAGCESPRAPITVTVYYMPHVAISSGKDYACIHDTVSLVYSGYPNPGAMTDGAYTWSLPPGSTLVGSNASTPGPIVVRFDSVGVQTVFLTVADGGGMCYNTNSINIKVEAPPTAGFYMKPTACVMDTLLLALTEHSTDAVNFIWDMDGANIVTANSNSGGPYEITWSSPGIHYIQMYTTTDKGCRSDNYRDTIKITTPPNASFTPGNRDSLCLSDSILLIALTVAPENSYIWAPGHFFENNNKPAIYGKAELEGYVSLTVTDPYGCVGRDSLEIPARSCCQISFPTAFTPNNDGKNDRFRPISSGYHKFHIFRVVNRWGQTVYETSDMNNGWDGKYNGVDQDLDVYYYYIKYECENKVFEKRGEVTLIR